eukprot:GHVS01086191.1.p2 GENE.GHVS01086191.1~~GHVS01086191.1.p2  ORF type:complete len:127 (+),score=42.41 GHVS01086191.1:298-678(+)
MASSSAPPCEELLADGEEVRRRRSLLDRYHQCMKCRADEVKFVVISCGCLCCSICAKKEEDEEERRRRRRQKKEEKRKKLEELEGMTSESSETTNTREARVQAKMRLYCPVCADRSERFLHIYLTK